MIDAGMITGVTNAPGCDPNTPWLETVGVSAVTTNASIASSRIAIHSNLLSQSSSSSSFERIVGGPSSQVSTHAAPGSSGLGSGSASAATLFSSSSGSQPTYTGTGSSISTATSIDSYTSTAGAPGSGSASSGASLSGLSAFPYSSTFLSTPTSRASYVSQHPYGCSEIM